MLATVLEITADLILLVWHAAWEARASKAAHRADLERRRARTGSGPGLAP